MERPRPLAVLGGTLLLAALCAPMFIQLGRWPLIDPDEGRNAEVAREMLASGQWLVPHFNGLPFLDKPPFLFWAIASSFAVFDLSEVAARLPVALSGAAVVLLTFALGRTLLDARRGFWAAAIVATSPLVLIFSRLVIFDMPFTALVTLALYALVRAQLSPRPPGWLCVAGLSMGVAVLTKGPVGFVLPLLGWMAARSTLPRSEHWAPRHAWLATIPFAAAVAAPWVIQVAWAEPDFLRYALFEETVQRFVSPARFHRSGPFYYPWLVAFSGLGVWAAVLLAFAPLGTSVECSTRERATVSFGLRAAGAMLLFFSLCASKRPGYVLPAFVPLALVVAVGVTAARRRAVAAVQIVGTGAVVAGAFILGTQWLDGSAWLGLDLDLGEASSALHTGTVIAGAVTILVWGTLVLTSRRVSPRASLALAAIAAPALYLALLAPLESYAAGRSAKTLAGLVPPGAELLSFRHFRTGLPFYERRAIPFASFDGHELTSNYVIGRSDRLLAEGRLLSPADGRELVGLADSLYLLTDASHLKKLKKTRRGPLTVVWADRRSVLLASDG